MSQFPWTDLAPLVDTGTDLANELNSVFPALMSTHSGTSRPSYAVKGTLWLDTTTATEHKLYIFDGKNDQLIGSFDPAKINSIKTGNVPVAASQTEVDAGTNGVKFVSSLTLENKPRMGRTTAPQAGEIGEIFTFSNSDLMVNHANLDVRFVNQQTPSVLVGEIELGKLGAGTFLLNFNIQLFAYFWFTAAALKGGIFIEVGGETLYSVSHRSINSGTDFGKWYSLNVFSTAIPRYIPNSSSNNRMEIRTNVHQGSNDHEVVHLAIGGSAVRIA